MKTENIVRAARFVSQIMDMSLERGVRLSVGDDFAAYAQIVAQHRAHQPIGPPFDPARHFLRQGNSLWILGHDKKGRLVHTQAMRQLDLAGMTLSDFFNSTFRSFPPAGVPLDMGASRYRAGPAAANIRGNVFYHGDVWLAGGNAGLRGTGIASLFARFAQALCYMRFQADYVVAFMPQEIAFKGLTEREGYMHAEPGTLQWMRADCDEFINGFMVWNGQTDIEYLLEMPLEPLVKGKVKKTEVGS